MHPTERLARLATILSDQHEAHEQTRLDLANALEKVEKLEAQVALLEEQVEKAKGKSKEKAAA